MNHWEFSHIPFEGDLTDDKIVCQNCGWSWKVKDDGDDLYVCHKCFYDNQSEYSNFFVDVGAIIGAAGQVAGAVGNVAQARANKKLSKSDLQKEVDTRCGKDKSQRWRRKKVREEYINCKNQVLQKIDTDKQLPLEQQQRQQQQQQQELLLKLNQQKHKRTQTYVIIGVVALILGFAIYKKNKK
jgi:hypothetical protein